MCVNLALLPNKKYSIHGVCLETTWCLQRTYFVSRIVTLKMRSLEIMIEELERWMPVKEWPDWRKRFQHPNTSAMRCPYCPRYSGYKTHPDLRPLCISVISHSKKMFQNLLWTTLYFFEITTTTPYETTSCPCETYNEEGPLELVLQSLDTTIIWFRTSPSASLKHQLHEYMSWPILFIQRHVAIQTQRRPSNIRVEGSCWKLAKIITCQRYRSTRRSTQGLLFWP